MKVVRILLTSTDKRGNREGQVPISVQMAFFFTDLSDFFVEKKVAKNLQVEKIGIHLKNSEDYVKSRVNCDSLLP